MPDRTDHLPAAHHAWRDAEETTDYEHRDCPAVAPVPQRWVGPDGRSVVVVTDRPDCIAEEMELRGGCRLAELSAADRAALAVRCPDDIGGMW